MADEKGSAQTEDTSPSTTDFLSTIKDPAGSPLNRNVKGTNLHKMSSHIFLSKVDETAAPTVNDDASDTSGNGIFEVGSLWIDVTADVVYQCVDSTATAAVWKNLSAVSALVNTTSGVAHATGSAWVVRKDNMAAAAPPTTGDDTGDGYIVGSFWHDTTNDQVWIAIDVTAAAAVWLEVGGANFSIQVNGRDISGGNADYVIYDDSFFPFTVESLNACVLDAGTATVTLKINSTGIGGISQSATTSKQTVRDAATSANSVVVTDELSINIADHATAATLSCVIHCKRNTIS